MRCVIYAVFCYVFYSDSHRWVCIKYAESDELCLSLVEPKTKRYKMIKYELKRMPIVEGFVFFDFEYITVKKSDVE
jgi:hypothetical protein